MSFASDHFEIGGFNHVFGHAVPRSDLFETDRDYRFFLKKFYSYLSDILDTFCYCLLPNHFHFLVRVKNGFPLLTQDDCTKVVSERFRRLFISYSMSFNAVNNRRGSLFERPFKRKLVGSGDHLEYLVYYIHHNPEKHHLIKEFRDYLWSSYKALRLGYETPLCDSELLRWFGGWEGFVQFHEEEQSVSKIQHFTIENKDDIFFRKMSSFR